MAKEKEDERILAFTWYHEEDYVRLIEATDDQEGLKENYQAWLADARRAFTRYKRLGFEPTRVYLDVEEYLGWCDRRERPVNEKSREMFKEIKRQEFYRNLDKP